MFPKRKFPTTDKHLYIYVVHDRPLPSIPLGNIEC